MSHGTHDEEAAMQAFIEFSTERGALSIHRDDRTDLCPKQSVEILDAAGNVVAVVRYRPNARTYPGGSALTIEVADGCEAQAR